MTHIKVKENASYVRDENSGAILNTNISEYHTYLQQKALKELESQEIKNLEEDVNSIKTDLEEIKGLLRRFLNGS